VVPELWHDAGPDLLDPIGRRNGMKVGYARTSTLEQVAGFEAQIAALEAAGCEKVFREQVTPLILITEVLSDVASCYKQ
jgi:hypothetical protein